MNRNKLVSLGIIIKQIRKSKNLSMDKVSAKAYISKSLLSKIENFRTVPSLLVLIRIANALSTNMSELFAGIDENDESDYVVTRKKEVNKLYYL